MPLQRLLDRLPPRARLAVDLAVGTARGATQDRITGLAAEVAFWVVLSLPPMLLVLASAAGVIGQGTGVDVRGQLIGRIEQLALHVFQPSTVDAAITPTLDALLERGSPSVLSLSFLVALYSASRVLRAVVHAVTMAYLSRSRPPWLNRLMGLWMTLAMLVLGVILIPVVIAGPRLGEIIERRLGLQMGLTEVWAFAIWPATLVVMTLLVAGLYHYAVPWRTPFRRELPGAALATVLGLFAGTGLRAYTAYAFASQEGEGSESIYVSLAAPLAVLLWAWLQAIALLLGAELNAEIEKMWPRARVAKDPVTFDDARRWVWDRWCRLRGMRASGSPAEDCAPEGDGGGPQPQRDRGDQQRKSRSALPDPPQGDGAAQPAQVDGHDGPQRGEEATG